MIAQTDTLSIGTLLRTFWGKILITWGLTLMETAFFALMPLALQNLTRLREITYRINRSGRAAEESHA